LNACAIHSQLDNFLRRDTGVPVMRVAKAFCFFTTSTAQR
jgi:hypothetical protein